MEIRDLIKIGASVSVPYKEERESWMGTAEIHPFAGGFGCKPRIIVQVPTLEISGRAEFEIGQIDEAVSLFEKLVFNRKNLAFKMHEAVLFFTSIGEDLDLDEIEDFQKAETKRLELIEEYENK